MPTPEYTRSIPSPSCRGDGKAKQTEAVPASVFRPLITQVGRLTGRPSARRPMTRLTRHHDFRTAQYDDGVGATRVFMTKTKRTCATFRRQLVYVKHAWRRKMQGRSAYGHYHVGRGYRRGRSYAPHPGAWTWQPGPGLGWNFHGTRPPGRPGAWFLADRQAK